MAISTPSRSIPIRRARSTGSMRRPSRSATSRLQPGETLTAVSAGDTVRWVIGDTTSGSGDTQRVHVLVKPFAPGLKTNLVITTDRRSYHLQLESTERTAMAAISWTYPQDQLIALQRQNEQAEAAAPVASGVALENLRFRYAISRRQSALAAGARLR